MRSRSGTYSRASSWPVWLRPGSVRFYAEARRLRGRPPKYLTPTRTPSTRKLEPFNLSPLARLAITRAIVLGLARKRGRHVYL